MNKLIKDLKSQLKDAEASAELYRKTGCMEESKFHEGKAAQIMRILNGIKNGAYNE